MNFRETIENQEILELPNLAFGGKIHLVETPNEQLKAAEYLSKFDALGFDTEAKPSFRKGVIHPVSLLQLATEEDAFLFRLKNNKPIKNILEILENESIVKIGVAITDDIADLRKLEEFKPGGFIALEQYVKQAGVLSNGLRKLAAIVLNGRISKGAQVSNWEAKELSKKQKVYAATDAWVGLMIYKKMIAKGYHDHP